MYFSILPKIRSVSEIETIAVSLPGAFSVREQFLKLAGNAHFLRVLFPGDNSAYRNRDMDAGYTV
jgi:hypothetical protein